MAKRPENDADLEALFSKRPTVIKAGLERMRRAYEILDLPEQMPPCILVAGTNGKGSTAGMLWHLLATLGLPVGLYTSPHLCRFRERIQCSHTPVTDQAIRGELAALGQRLPADLYEELSFFEITTLVALRLFIKAGCRFLVLEVGLGGRWDATNVVEPLAAAVVSIDRDHEQWLGSELGAIAHEKLGVARRDKPLFWGELAEKPQVAASLAASHTAKGFELVQAGTHFCYDPTRGQVQLQLPGLKPWQGPLPGCLQAFSLAIQHNFALSMALFYWLQATQADLRPRGLSLEELCQQALSNFGAPSQPWPHTLIGRFQELHLPAGEARPATRFILDVCHNPAAVDAFMATLTRAGYAEAGKRRLPALVSILADKDINTILDRLRLVCEPVILFMVASPRSLQASDRAPHHQDLVVFADFAKAWDYAKTMGNGYPGPWVVCGSFLAVGEVINYFSAFPEQQHLTATLTGHWPSASDHHASPDSPS